MNVIQYEPEKTRLGKEFEKEGCRMNSKDRSFGCVPQRPMW
jgi:hypothetical protein